MSAGNQKFVGTLRRGGPLAIFALLLSCGAASLGDVARREDLPALRSALTAKQKGGLDDAERRELAYGVAERELLTSQGDAAVARLRETLPCMGALAATVKQRAEADASAEAAAAALTFVEAGLGVPDVNPQLLALNVAQPAWRAVAVRVLTAQSAEVQTLARARLFLDADLHVRRAALRSAIASPALAELRALLDVAQRDPDMQTRSYAIRALAKLKAENAASGLREQWERADETLRQVIVEAWVELADFGGAKHLAWLLAGSQSLPRVLAAARSLRFPAFQMQAEQVLKQSLGPGNAEQRVAALQLAPLSEELLPLFVVAAKEGPTRVRLAANAALVALPTQRETAQKRLRALAEEKDVNVVAAATSRLVALGDVSVAPALVVELKSKHPSTRATAARHLLALGRGDAVLETLVDDVASVRMQTACAFLVNSRLR